MREHSGLEGWIKPRWERPRGYEPPARYWASVGTWGGALFQSAYGTAPKAATVLYGEGDGRYQAIWAD